MTLDSDTFCRFQVLARKLRHEHPDFKPREQSILLGRMGQHLVYFENKVTDGSLNSTEEDLYIKGSWYSYPSGIGYVLRSVILFSRYRLSFFTDNTILSSNTTATLLSADPPVPHHIHYPFDDVMIGSWLAALKNFHDPSIEYMTTEDHPPGLPVQRVYPKPYTPHAVETEIVDEVVGWHDFKGRGGHDSPIGWESVCVHRMTPPEMRAFRGMEEVKGEWDSEMILVSDKSN